MEQAVSQFISLLKQRDLQKLESFFQAQAETIQTNLLLFLALQIRTNDDSADYFQLLCTKLCADKTMPSALISHIKNIELLSFFTPLLQSQNNFALQDTKERNVLHYLFVARGEKNCVPFNYLRSLLLFERNLFLPKGLTQTESNNLTPIESYLHLNIQGIVLPDHELTAFMALFEIEQSQRTVNSNNLKVAVSRFKKQAAYFELSQQYLAQKSLLLASYYGVSINEVNAIAQN